MSAAYFSSEFKEFTSQKMLPDISGGDPEWLASLRGKSPLLELAELECIDEMRRHIIQEARCRPNIPCDLHLKDKLSLMKDNFGKVVKYLKEISQSNEYFLLNYPKWRFVRNQTISHLVKVSPPLTEIQ